MAQVNSITRPGNGNYILVNFANFDSYIVISKINLIEKINGDKIKLVLDNYYTRLEFGTEAARDAAFMQLVGYL